MSESGSVAQGFGGWRATGVGSLPGRDPGEAASMVAGELPDWPHLPELPGRGPGADMIGRAMSMLAAVSTEFAVETGPQGWRRAASRGRDMRRAEAHLAADFDAAAEHLAGCTGPFTVAMAGPWTLAASVSDAWGERALRDRGYVADICAAHADAATELVRRARRAVPGAQVVLALDEPSLAAVHEGRIPFTSGYRRHPAVPVERLATGLRPVGDAVRAAGAALALHSCAKPVWGVVSDLRPQWLGLDVTTLRDADTDLFGSWLESGAGTIWGVWPTTGPARDDETDRAFGRITGWLDRLGYSSERMPAGMAVAARCGLAGLARADALAAMKGVRAIAARLGETG